MCLGKLHSRKACSEKTWSASSFNFIFQESKYKLQPADYSPPTIRKANFSAISGPSLPSGPYLPVTEGSPVEDDNDDWSDARLSIKELSFIKVYLKGWFDFSTLSFEDAKENFSAAVDISVRSDLPPTSSVSQTKKSGVLIKPKERKGEVLQPMALPSPKPTRNALEDIGFQLADKKNVRFFQHFRIPWHFAYCHFDYCHFAYDSSPTMTFLLLLWRPYPTLLLT